MTKRDDDPNTQTAGPIPQERSSGRRKFLLATLGAVTASAGGLVGYGEYQKRKRSRSHGTPDRPGIVDPRDVVTQRRRLGRTNLQVSIVGIGAGDVGPPDVLARAVAKGMNYIDTSVCYGDSELLIRAALAANPGLREKMIIATQWDSTVDWTKEDFLKSLDRSLERLGVDQIDIMQVHWLGGGHIRPDTGFNRLANSALYEAIDAARASKKVRFFGVTSHDANRSKILMHAIDGGAFDMLLVKMNILDYEKDGIPELLAKARAKDVGVVAMKSQPSGGAVPAGFETHKYSIYQANLRWVLAHPEVACVVHSKVATDPTWQDAAASAVQTPLAARDVDLLEEYASALSPEHCRGCTECSAACPAGIAIPHVLQFDMYADRYGWHERARDHYAALPPETRWSETCLSCSKCSDACPYDVDAASRVRRARLLGA